MPPFFPHYAFPHFLFLLTVLLYPYLLFGAFLHCDVVRHLSTWVWKCLQPVLLSSCFSSGCITSVVPSSWPRAEPGTPFSPLGLCFPVCCPKWRFPVAKDGSFVYFCLSRSQPSSRKCFRSPFLDGVTPLGQIWKPEERPPKIGLPLEARALGDFKR